MKIGELARRSGRSTHTLRYYERIGLLGLFIAKEVFADRATKAEKGSL